MTFTEARNRLRESLGPKHRPAMHIDFDMRASGAGDVTFSVFAFDGHRMISRCACGSLAEAVEGVITETLRLPADAAAVAREMDEALA